jgi:tetratricopeptide (TPR) repeat protein
LKRIFVIVFMIVPLAAPVKAQMAPCRDFTIGPTLQVEACNSVIGVFGLGGIGSYSQRTNAFLLRGAAFARKGDKVNATADYQHAIRMADDSTVRADQPFWHTQRCWVRAVAGIDLDIALSQCNEALRLRPNLQAALDSRGFVYLRLRRYRDAIADYNAALKQNPRLPYSLLGRAVAKFHLGDNAGAKDDATAAEAIEPAIIKEFTAYDLE